MADIKKDTDINVWDIPAAATELLLRDSDDDNSNVDQTVKLESGRFRAYKKAKIHSAVGRGRLVDVCLMMHEGQRVIDEPDRRGRVALHHAVDKKNKLMTELLLKSNADINVCDFNGDTPLHIAAAQRSEKMLDLLIDNGARVDLRNMNGQSAADVASSKITQIRLLSLSDMPINNSTSVDSKEASLASGVSRDSFEEVNDDADTNKTSDVMMVKVDSKNAIESIQSAIKDGNSEFSLDFLKDANVDLDQLDDEGWSCLHLACAHGMFGIAKSLLDFGAGPNVPTNEGDTPLHCATFAQHVNVVKLLLKCGADADKKNSEGLSSIDLASDAPKILEILNQSIQKRGKAKKKALPRAKRSPVKSKPKKEGIVKDGILELHPSILKLHQVMKSGQGVITAIKNCVDIHQPDALGRTALHIAVQFNCVESTFQMLLSGAKVNCKGPRGSTPLHLAALAGHLQIARLLLSYEADISIRNNDGQIAADLANSVEMKEILGEVILPTKKKLKIKPTKQEASRKSRRSVNTESKQEASTKSRRSMNTESKQEASTKSRRSVNTERKQDASTKSRKSGNTERKQEASTKTRRSVNAERKQETSTKSRRGGNTERKQEASTKIRGRLASKKPSVKKSEDMIDVDGFDFQEFDVPEEYKFMTQVSTKVALSSEETAGISEPADLLFWVSEKPHLSK